MPGKHEKTMDQLTECQRVQIAVVEVFETYLIQLLTERTAIHRHLVRKKQMFHSQFTRKKIIN